MEVELDYFILFIYWCFCDIYMYYHQARKYQGMVQVWSSY